jgi:hypothetical protein
VTNAAYGEVPPAQMLAGSAAYALVYNAVVIAAAILVFSRRNFK